MTNLYGWMSEIEEYSKKNKVSIADACALFTAASAVEANRNIAEMGGPDNPFIVGIYNHEGRAFDLGGSVVSECELRTAHGETLDVDARVNASVSMDDFE